MASNGASARGLRQVGYFDCPGGGQVVVDGRVAYIAHMKGPDGTTLVDVSDPKSPRRLAGLEVPPGTHSHKVRAANGLMLVNREAHPAHKPEAGVTGGLGIHDVSDPTRPREITFWRSRRRRRPPLHLRRALRLHLARDGRLRRQYRDDPRPGRSREAAGSRALVDARAVDGGRRDAVVAGPPPPLPSSDPVRRPPLRQLLARRLRDPRHRGHVEADVRLRASTGARPSSRRPTPRSPSPSRSAGAACCSWPTRTWPSSSRGRRPSSGWSTSRTSGGRCRSRASRWRAWTARPQPEFTGCHQPTETITATEVPVAWFAYGLRIVDIADPHAPREVAHYLPECPRDTSRVSSNDVFVDDRGLIYLIDRGRGLSILERV